MSDMKVRITVEDSDGTTRTATLSFGGAGAEEKKANRPRNTLLDRFEEMEFTVRRELPVLEPGMIGEIHVERLYGERDRCCRCGEPTWILMEVIEDDTDAPDPEYPFVDVDHDLIGDFCIACGHYHLNDEMIGTGVFGLLDDEEDATIGDFLDKIAEDPPDELVRAHLLNALLRQERLHSKAVFRIRQRIAQMRVEKHEAQVLEMKEKEDEP